MPVRGARAQKILAMLALHADRPVPLESLIDAVWDDDPPATAATQVRNRVSGLRRSWDRAVARPDNVLTTEGSGYRLRLAGHDLDLWEFDRCVSAARAAAGADDHAEAARLLRAALGCWRGPALCGIGGRISTAAAALLEERRLLATEECLGHELVLGRHRQLIVEISALVAAHPFRERFTHHLLLALYRSERQADALACYQHYVRTLRDELGLDPGPELRALHEAILRRSATIAVPGAGRPDPAPVEAADAPVPGAVTPRPAEIPADLADFTGRARELAEFDAFLRPATGPTSAGMLIIAVTGTAGVGKTALAIRWAHRVATRFPDGQLHVNLWGQPQEPPMRPYEALATMLRALGVDADHVPAGAEEAARLFRSMLADKRMLLVLDNAFSAEQVRPLLPGGSGCLVLVTSRNRLAGLVASHGARQLTVDPLDEDEAMDLLSRILGPHRVAGEPQASSLLARACAFLPLALRIAAANLGSGPHRSIAGYVDELRRGDPLAALRIVGDSLAVQSVFDASYAGLSAVARRVFRLLGFAPGPEIGLAAVAALIGVSTAQAALVVDQLTANHLVQPSGPGRFTVHELLRAYMRQRAEAEDGQEERTAAAETLLRFDRHGRAVA